MSDEERKKQIQKLALSFSEGFFGYASSGSWQCRYWAIGLEERGCRNGAALIEAHARLMAWTEMGNHKLVDLEEYCRQLEERCTQLKGTFRSPTWDALAELFAPALRMDATDCKGDKFPKKLANELLLSELQPLACPDRAGWPWGDWLPDWQKKPNAKSPLIHQRIKLLGDRILANKRSPIVVCYGSQIRSWNLLAETARRKVVVFKQSMSKRDLHAREDPIRNEPGKVLIVLPHPAAWGNPLPLYTDLGQLLAKLR